MRVPKSLLPETCDEANLASTTPFHRTQSPKDRLARASAIAVGPKSEGITTPRVWSQTILSAGPSPSSCAAVQVQEEEHSHSGCIVSEASPHALQDSCPSSPVECSRPQTQPSCCQAQVRAPNICLDTIVLQGMFTYHQGWPCCIHTIQDIPLTYIVYSLYRFSDCIAQPQGLPCC